MHYGCFCLGQLPDCFGQLKKLENIQLGHNLLRSLPFSFTNLSSLRQITLSNNRFTTIPDSILKLQNLQLLDLSSNQISQIPDQIQTLQADELNLNDNQVSKIYCYLFNIYVLVLDHKNLGSYSSLSSFEDITFG